MAWVQEMFGQMDGWDGMEGRMDTLCHRNTTVFIELQIIFWEKFSEMSEFFFDDHQRYS